MKTAAFWFLAIGWYFGKDQDIIYKLLIVIIDSCILTNSFLTQIRDIVSYPTQQAFTSLNQNQWSIGPMIIIGKL